MVIAAQGLDETALGGALLRREELHEAQLTEWRAAAEMALGLVPAAMGNAVFDATGVRLRKVPFTPASVKAALNA